MAKCVMCAAEQEKATGSEAIGTLLVMFTVENTSIDSVLSTLCVNHTHRVGRGVAEVMAEHARRIA